MAGNPFWPWVERIAALTALAGTRGWATQAEIRAALSHPPAPDGLVAEFTAMLAAQGVQVLDGAAPPDLLSLLEARLSEAMRQLVARGQARGYVTVAELNAALPSDEVSSEVIEDHLATLSDLGIDLVEAEDE